ncbi:hypothetical protein [Mucilaginibacter sp.]|uniref:hypothetical protein n=1 Tax=Mucilaginibacter sp. TaxID=1882438 RepID=UPI00374D1701
MSENGDEIISLLLPENSQKPKRKPGILEGEVKVVFAPDFKITEEEFLNPK